MWSVAVRQRGLLHYHLKIIRQTNRAKLCITLIGWPAKSFRPTNRTGPRPGRSFVSRFLGVFAVPGDSTGTQADKQTFVV